MTNSEKMVWAAVFAKEYNLRDRPRYLTETDNYNKAAEEWEKNQVAHAIEAAGYAVDHLREAKNRVKSGWGEVSIVWKLYQDFLGT